MAASDAAGAELSKDSEMIKIGSRLWKIGEKVYSIGVEAVEKAKMVETFGDAWRTARAEGEILGRSGIRKVEVKWTNPATSSKIRNMSVIILCSNRTFKINRKKRRKNALKVKYLPSHQELSVLILMKVVEKYFIHHQAKSQNLKMILRETAVAVLQSRDFLAGGNN